MRGQTYGVEVATTWQVAEWWRIYAASTFLKMHLEAEPGVASSNEAPEGQSPEHQFYLRSSWDLPHHFEFDVIARSVHELFKSNPPVPSYIALDARLAWTPHEGLEFAIVGQNLLDNHHPEAGRAALLASPSIEVPRGVYGTVTYRW